MTATPARAVIASAGLGCAPTAAGASLATRAGAAGDAAGGGALGAAGVETNVAGEKSRSALFSSGGDCGGRESKLGMAGGRAAFKYQAAIPVKASTAAPSAAQIFSGERARTGAYAGTPAEACSVPQKEQKRMPGETG